MDNNKNEHEKIETLEPMKEVIINEKSAGKTHYVFLVVIFVLLFVIVFFLPDITGFIASFKKADVGDNIITTGKLICELEDSDDSFDYNYKDEFSFVDSKFKTLTHSVTIKGDTKVDAASFELLNNQCLMLKETANTILGINVSCDSDIGTVFSKQEFNYEKLDPTEISAAYVEAGGVLPTYSLDTDITTIEKQMNAEGYTCKRVEN